MNTTRSFAAWSASTLRRFAAWFTTARRQLIQVFLGSLAPILILTGVATQSQTELGLVLTGAAAQFVASLLSLVNVRFSLSNAWTVARGAIYLLATTAAPALTSLGVISDAFSETGLLAVSLGLSSLSGLLAIFTAGQQETQVAVIAAVADEVAGMEAVVTPDGDAVPLTRAQYRAYLDALADDARAVPPLSDTDSVVRGED